MTGVADRSSFTITYLPVFYLPVIGRSFNWLTYGWAMRRLKPLVEDCDAVYSTWLYPDGVAATRLAATCGKRAWIMVQGSDTFHLENSCRRSVILDACEKAAGLVCVCRTLADRIIDAGVSAEKVHVAPNGVDGSMFRFREKGEASAELMRRMKGASREAMDLASTISSGDAPRLVLFVGNLVSIKGPDLLLSAWKSLIADHRILAPGVVPKLAIIGEGAMRRNLERDARAMGMADSVIFLGSRPHDEVALWMNIADCLCLTSRSEGMPNVVIEALACGLPIVATKVGAVPELLAGEPAGRVVAGAEDGDASRASGIAQALADVLTVSVDRRAIAERRQGQHSWAKQAAQILDLIALPGRKEVSP